MTIRVILSIVIVILNAVKDLNQQTTLRFFGQTLRMMSPVIPSFHSGQALSISAVILSAAKDLIESKLNQAVLAWLRLWFYSC
ncbi:MAG TPA: hypothetical protein DCZ93_07305 [Elusimicrobia bacterium]|nr:hypothetical protein [Elusimicrobiota bacterium]